MSSKNVKANVVTVRLSALTTVTLTMIISAAVAIIVGILLFPPAAGGDRGQYCTGAKRRA